MSALKNLVSEIDRASELRTSQSELDKQWAKAKIMHIVDARLAVEGAKLHLLDSTEISALIASGKFLEGERYFLGLDRADGTSYFAWHTAWTNEPGSDEEKYSGFETLREIGSSLSPKFLSLAFHAIGLANWHEVHPRCSRCGAPTIVGLGGSVRICTEDESQHHPRTDSAVIVLVKDKDDRLLLGHNPIWPEKRFSNFAGFLEPGETFEQCVARDVFEESGITVDEISYMTSQPWPFPASIMIAFSAITNKPHEAKGDGIEITEVRWFSRDEMKEAIKTGELLLPPSISVARRMIESWYSAQPGRNLGDLVGGESWRP